MAPAWRRSCFLYVHDIADRTRPVSDVNKDWRCKDKDKDLNLVLKEFLRTRTRTNISDLCMSS